MELVGGSDNEASLAVGAVIGGTVLVLQWITGDNKEQDGNNYCKDGGNY